MRQPIMKYALLALLAFGALALAACGDDLTTNGFDMAAAQDFAGSTPDLGSTDGAPTGG